MKFAVGVVYVLRFSIVTSPCFNARLKSAYCISHTRLSHWKSSSLAYLGQFHTSGLFVEFILTGLILVGITVVLRDIKYFDLWLYFRLK